MMFRIMLVGIVAGLGLELPSGQDVSRWTQSGRDFVNARVSDLSDLGSEAGGTSSIAAPVVAVETAKPTVDSAFEAVSSEIADEFRVDQVALRSNDSDLTTSPNTLTIAEAEPAPAAIEVAAEAPAVVAVEAEVAPVATSPAVVADEPAATSASEADEAEPAMLPEVEDESASRRERFEHAMQLTREAARAWSSLLQQPADDTGVSY